MYISISTYIIPITLYDLGNQAIYTFLVSQIYI